ncbi:hypothetical protein, partial [Alistipes putredinis]|uniref:hypothetical protein n=1 Tax=Alistipes putredinis TaxID=28117 RepID=UPI003AF92F3E
KDTKRWTLSQTWLSLSDSYLKNKDTKSREKTGIVPVFRGAAYLTEAMSKIIIFRKTDLTASGWS